MTNEELVALIQSGHQELLNDLISQNMDFIKATANQLYIRKFPDDKIIGLGIDDLIQEGCIKLWESVDTYDSSAGYLFLTYAGRNVKNKMKDCIRRAKATLEGQLSYNPKFALTEQRINDVISNEDGRQTRAELLTNPYQKKTDIVALDQIEITEMYKALHACTPRHKSLLLYHYGFLDLEGHTYVDTARHFHKTIGKIKIEKREALKDIRGNFSQYPLGWEL